jgi:hypothetical protein
MSTRPQLEYPGGDANSDSQAQSNADLVDRLRRENKQLNNVLNDKDEVIADLRKQLARMGRGQAKLKSALSPVHQALQMIFDELDDVPDDAGGTAVPARVAGAWDLWKQKLGGKQAEFIQAMMDHGPMSREQLRVTTRSGWSTVDATLAKLRTLTLINKNSDGKWALKQI